MNRTQKGALMTLSAFLLNAAFLGYLFIRIFVLKGLPRMSESAPLLLAFAAMATWWVALSRRRQSPAEPEADERDKAIMKNAILAGFISILLFLAATVLVLAIVVGEAGSVPVYVLTFILFGVCLAAGLVYSVAILVQYGRAGKGDSL
ncbi:MAG: hypothetical protein ABFD90_02565 [Phycisphaerales bacterium]